ncbi:helix-turn-helix transcriptional regulator [Emcibacter sp.]|uniref:helix-turn-helix transcriptional regulator n=1 Tax=Emcibacter sp. TaxID=1979954 RepID=UPI003A94E130
MQVPTQSDINRIYEGFNEAYHAEPERFEFLDISRFGDTDNGLRLQLNDDVAQGYWELYRPNNELLICLAEGHYHAPYSQEIVPTRDLVTLRFVLSGDYGLMFDNLDNVTIPPASASIIYTEEDRKFDLSIANDSHLSSVTLHMKPEFLYKGFGVDRASLPSHLQDVVFGDAGDKNLYNFPLSPGMMNNILDLLRMPYQGARRRIFTEAKTAELICRLFQEIEDDFKATPVLATPAHTLKMKLYEAQRILVANYRSPPTIAVLARKVGLNRTRLCMEFREMFGVTIAEFAQSYRMNKARELLQDRNLSISQVAEAVGYEHPTNFTAAFKKQYGFLPKVIRLL